MSVETVGPALLTTVQIFGSLILAVAVAWFVAKRIVLPEGDFTPRKVARVAARVLVVVAVVIVLEPTFVALSFVALDLIGVEYQVID